MLGERLKEERKRLKLTQPDLADSVDASKRTVIDWEKDKTSPTAIQLMAMSKVGVDVSYLITGTRTPEVEMTVLDKVTKAEKNAQAIGNKAGADNLAQAVDDMVAGQIRRGKNAQRRADELRQIMYMLCDMDDEQFEKAYQAIADIHSQF